MLGRERAGWDCQSNSDSFCRLQPPLAEDNLTIYFGANSDGGRLLALQHGRACP